MDKKKTDWLKKLILLVVSISMVFILLGLGEFYCRFFTHINFLDHSRGLFVPSRYGTSYGNTPNFTGISFGEKYFIDENGFRIDPKFKSAAPSEAPSILIIGDSVSFGTGVKEEMTVTGRLRRKLPSVRIYNASAIGYDTFDYKNVVNSLVKQKSEIKTVLLFYCLNDLNDVSAQQIRIQTNNLPNTDEPENQSLIRSLNNYLRSRSKLYLWLKNALLDAQMIYFRNDLTYYQKDQKIIHEGLQPLAEIKKKLDSISIAFKVFILPYEAQVRSNSVTEFMLPQKIVTDFLRQNAIDYADITSDFQKIGTDAHYLFLYGDPMHLSERGHQLVAEIVCSKLQNCPAQ
jgi:lysophospholipase L1-like esterase